MAYLDPRLELVLDDLAQQNDSTTRVNFFIRKKMSLVLDPSTIPDLEIQSSGDEVLTASGTMTTINVLRQHPAIVLLEGCNILKPKA